MKREISQSIIKNTSVMMGAQVLTWISSFVLLMFLPRYLGSVEFGRLYLALSIAMIIEVLIDFGGAYMIPKEVSRAKERTANILVNFVSIRGIMWVIGMTGVLLFTWWAEYPPVTQLLILILGFSRVWEGATRALRSCFQGHERMEYPAMADIIERAFVSLAAVSALLLGAEAVTIAIVMAAGALLKVLIAIKFSSKIISHLPKVEWRYIRRLVSLSVPYFMWSLFSVIYYRVDAIMLSILTTDQVVGWYGAAYRFFDIVMVLPSILATVVFPIFSRLSVTEQKDMVLTFRKSLKFIVICAIPVAVLIFAYAENIISLFFGVAEYGPSTIVLQIFTIGIVLVYIDFVLGSGILAIDRQLKWAAVGLTAIFINIGLNLVLIGYAQSVWGNGGIGAAVSTLITELFILVSGLVMIPSEYIRTVSIHQVLKLSAAGAVMALLTWIMVQSGVFWILSAIIAAFLYLISLVILRVFDRNEQNMLYSILTIQGFKKLVATIK